jgi:hypothetical protein
MEELLINYKANKKELYKLEKKLKELKEYKPTGATCLLTDMPHRIKARMFARKRM